MGFMLGFGFQAWLLGLKPMGFGFRPPPVKPLQGAKLFIQEREGIRNACGGLDPSAKV